MTEPLANSKTAIAASSGTVAISSTLSTLDPEERVNVSPDLFQGTARVLNDQFRRWRIAMDAADAINLGEVAKAVTPSTKMIWIDTPSNSLMRITDIAAICDLARAKRICVAVYSTFVTFVLQKPIELGAEAEIRFPNGDGSRLPS